MEDPNHHRILAPDLSKASNTVFQDASLMSSTNDDLAFMTDELEPINIGDIVVDDKIAGKDAMKQNNPPPNGTVKLLRKYYFLNVVPYLSVSWCYLGNKHVYHVFGVDPFYWLVIFSLGTLYSSILLNCLVVMCLGCVVMYTFQETPTFRNEDDESDSSSDDSDSETDENEMLTQQQHTIRRSTSISSEGSVSENLRNQLGSGLRRRPTATPPTDIDDELRGIFGN